MTVAARLFTVIWFLTSAGGMIPVSAEKSRRDFETVGESGFEGLIRLHSDGKADFVGRYYSLYSGTGHYSVEGETIRIFDLSELEEVHESVWSKVLEEGWEQAGDPVEERGSRYANFRREKLIFEGSLSAGELRGRWLGSRLPRQLEATEIEVGSFHYPLEAGEKLLLVECAAEVPFRPNPDVPLGEYLKQHSRAVGRQEGWIFSVIAPKEFEGRYLSFHLCGLPRRYAVEGKRYLMRIHEDDMRREAFGACDTVLRGLEDMGDFDLHPRYPLTEKLKSQIRLLLKAHQ